MNRLTLRFFVPALGLFLIPLPGGAVAQESNGPKPKVWEKGNRERNEGWETLKPEQREKLREALREVWTDPAVISAREEIKHASDAYQAAIKAAVGKFDPTVAELLAKVQGSGWKGGERGGPNFPGDPGGGSGMGSMRGFDEQLKPPGFLDSLPPETREKFRKAEAAAMETEAVKAAKAELAKIREEDEALRRKRLEAHRKLRRVTVDEMILIDPSIAAMQKKLSNGDRGASPASPRKEGGEKPGKPADPKPEADGRGKQEVEKKPE